MLTTIKLNGKEYPIDYGYRARYYYEKDTGVKILNSIANGIDHNTLIDLSLYALKTGHKKEGKTFNLDIDGVLDLLDSDNDSLLKLMEAFAESMPKGEEEKKANGQVKKSVKLSVK